jgi:uncharacterized phage infection (PIP) family protein YhgE
VAKEDTTPAPEKPGATPEGKKEKALPEKPEGETTPPQEVSEEVAGLKAQVEELTKKLGETETQLNQVKDMQRIADKARIKEKKAKEKLEQTLRTIRETGEIPPEESLEGTPAEREEALVARIAIQNLLIGNPQYQKLLEKDITLKTILIKNPLALISDWLDAEDAVTQVKDYLDKQLSSLEAQPKEGEEEKEEEIEAGAIQPPESIPPEIKTPSEKALEKGDIEKSIRSKIRVEGE